MYVDPVAPSMGWPSAIHWRWILPAGVQVPARPVRTRSTCGVPEIVGAAVAWNWPGATASLTWETTAFVA